MQAEPLSTGPSRLSPSGASTFVQCPRRWKFRYIDRLADPPGEDALVGSFAHRVLELLLQRDAELRTVAEARTIARSVWQETKEQSDYQDLQLDDEQARHFRWKAWKAIEGLWQLEDPTKIDVRATEQDVQAELAGVPFRGIVDRLEQDADGMIVTDYKSGKAPGPRHSRARLDQVLLYAAAVEASTGELPRYAQLLYLGQRTVGIDVNRQEITQVTDKLAETWRDIHEACHQDSFDAKPGPLCSWCPFVALCPQGNAEVERRTEAKAAQEAAWLSMAN